jgi:hypothetical protein
MGDTIVTDLKTVTALLGNQAGDTADKR